MKIAFYDTKEFDKSSFNALNKNHKITWIKEDISLESVNKAKGHDAVCTFVNSSVDKELIKKIAENGVKVILERSAGYNNIDLKQCEESGIKVYRVPAYSSESISEFAMSLLMLLNRNLFKAVSSTKNGNFALDGLQGEAIIGKTIGVIGTGRIGCGFIKIALGFGAKVIAYDKYPNQDRAKSIGFTYASLNDVLSKSDFISLHTIYNKETHHLINKSSIAKMKKGVIIINTSRGGLVNASDLLQGIKNGTIRGAGLDVYENEKGIFFFDRSDGSITDKTLLALMANDKVVLTGHQAYFTNLSLSQIAQTTIDNATAAEKNTETKTRIYLSDDGSKVING